MASGALNLKAAREIAAAIVLALAVAAYLGLVTDRASGGVGLSLLVPRLAARTIEIALLAWPGLVAAIALAEWLQIRHIAFYLLAGTATAVLAALLASAGVVPMEPGTGRIAWTVPVLTMGVAGGLVYWGWRGHRAGGDMPAAGSAPTAAEPCRRCARLALAAASVLAAFIALTEFSRIGLIGSLTENARQTAQQALASAGHGWARVEIDDAAARLTGTAPDDAAAGAALTTARTALAPMTGIPGVIAVVEDATTRAPPSGNR